MRCAICLVLAPLPAFASDVTIVGNEVWEAGRIAGIVGRAPDAPDAVAAWGEEALARLHAAYEAEGYVAERGWVVPKEGQVIVEVEEGHVDRTVFRGANALDKALLTQSLTLPKGIVHAPTLDEQLALLADAHHLRDVAWEVRDGDGYVVTHEAGPRPERVLIIEIAQSEPDGFTLDLSFDPVWGLVGEPGWAVPDAIADGDLLVASVAVGFPLQEYVWESDPKIRWVYGKIEAKYRAPQVGRFDPLIATHVALEQRPRPDRGLENVMVEDTGVRFGLARHDPGERPRPLLGVWFEQNAVVRAVPLVDRPDVDEEQLDNTIRFGLTVGIGWSPMGALLRLDLRPDVLAFVDGGVDVRGQPIVRVEAKGQTSWPTGRGFIATVRGRVVAVGGDHEIYDDYQLAGSYQRTFFGDAYYSVAAVQGELAVRWLLVGDLALGAYYQQSVFADRLARPDHAVVGATNSFGPSLHLLLLDQFAIDAYWAMGLGPRSWVDVGPTGHKFATTFYLSLGTAY